MYPCTPVPEAYTQAMLDIIQEEDSISLHGYMDNTGYPEVRQAIAENLNQRFGTDFEAKNMIMTVGAAGALNVIMKVLFDPGDELLVFAPYFTEYRNYCVNWGGVIQEVEPNYETFQPNLEDMAKKISPKTKAVIINNPVNPSGVLYSEETIQKMAAILEEKQQEYGHAIYIVSDEPYRELVYDGKEVPFLTKYYANTFVTYSFSKSLSIPGDRIGYIVVPNEMEDFSTVVSGLATANRTLGFVNAPALMQKAVARCLEEKTDIAFYDKNRQFIYEKLTEMGFEAIKPEGAFYLFLKSPVADEKKFVEAAKKYHIMLVNGTNFACPGYVRLAYCVPYERLERALPAFRKLAEEYGLAENV